MLVSVYCVHKNSSQTGNLQTKSREAQEYDTAEWIIKWKWGHSLTLTMMGYYNEDFQMADD